MRIRPVQDQECQQSSVIQGKCGWFARKPTIVKSYHLPPRHIDTETPFPSSGSLSPLIYMYISTHSLSHTHIHTQSLSLSRRLTMLMTSSARALYVDFLLHMYILIQSLSMCFFKLSVSRRLTMLTTSSDSRGQRCPRCSVASRLPL